MQGHLMKRLLLKLVAFVVVFLSACSSQASVQPIIANTTLNTAEAYLMRGDSYSEIKDYDHAIADYNQAIRLKPDYAEAYNNRGYAYYWKNEGAKAIADYSRALELRPHYAYAYNNRGAAYMASGHPDQAINDFAHALELQPDFPQAYINRGNAYLRLGRFGLAFADFRQGGANPVRTIALLCGIPAITALLGLVAMNIVRLWKESCQSRRVKRDVGQKCPMDLLHR
jgi:tetratricopeptide (TPR) repeat protein